MILTTTALQQLDGENPWPGLESFEENAHAFFFGRDQEAGSLRDRVLDAPVTVLYGRSGLGKTSLLRAGLFPKLREENFLPVYVRLELKRGSAALSRQLRQSVCDSIRADVPDAMLPSDEESLWEYLHRKDFELWSAQNFPLTPVIVIDQFEELFTLGGRVSDLVDAFRDKLGDLAENRIPAELAARIDDDEAVAERFNLRSRNYKLLISLREDFLPDLEGWCRIIPALGRSRVRLLPLRAEDAVDAVHKPAAHLMTEQLARRVVSIIAGDGLHSGRKNKLPDDGRLGDERGTAEVEPPLLSLFCRELNEERKRRGQQQFDEQVVEDAKRDTLSNYYSSCVGDLPPRVARFIESELITETGFRDSFIREDAVPEHLTDDELTQLIHSRLLRLEDQYGAQRIELTHDVLTGPVREHRDRRLAEEREAELEAEKQRQQAELQTARQHAAALRKRSRILAAVLAVTAIIAVVAGFLYVSAQKAQQQAEKAQQQADTRFREATSLRLISEAQPMLAGIRPGGEVRAFQQLLVARQLAQTPDDGPLLNALVKRINLIKIAQATSEVSSVAFSPDGTRIVSGGFDKTVRV